MPSPYSCDTRTSLPEAVRSLAPSSASRSRRRIGERGGRGRAARERAGAGALPARAGRRRGRRRPRVSRRARARPRGSEPARPRLRARSLGGRGRGVAPRAPPRRGGGARGPRAGALGRRPLRPAARPRRVPDPGRARARDRLRGAHAGRGRPEKYLNPPESPVFRSANALYACRRRSSDAPGRSRDGSRGDSTRSRSCARARRRSPPAARAHRGAREEPLAPHAHVVLLVSTATSRAARMLRALEVSLPARPPVRASALPGGAIRRLLRREGPEALARVVFFRAPALESRSRRRAAAAAARRGSARCCGQVTPAARARARSRLARRVRAAARLSVGADANTSPPSPAPGAQRATAGSRTPLRRAACPDTPLRHAAAPGPRPPADSRAPRRARPPLPRAP